MKIFCIHGKQLNTLFNYGWEKFSFKGFFFLDW